MKRQKERNDNKCVKMELHPQRGVALQFSGFEADEVGIAMDRIGRSKEFGKAVAAIMPGQTKKAVTYEGEYDGEDYDDDY